MIWVAIVTGGGTRMGAAAAKLLARNGDDVGLLGAVGDGQVLGRPATAVG